jgi:ABC-type transport system substrate-binding protein
MRIKSTFYLIVCPHIFSFVMHKILLLIFLSLSFMACNKLQKQDNDKLKVFRFNSPDGISSLDPIHAETEANVHAVSQFYNGLFEFDEDLHLQPCLAENYEISPTGTTYTIYLKQGVFFHNNPAFADGQGREMRAADVVYSFNRLLSPASGSMGGWIFQDRVLKKENGDISDTCFVAVDDYTLRIHLQQPFMPFLQLLSMPFAYVVPQEAVVMYGGLSKVAVGTGAFVFSEWLEYNYLTLKKNTRYFKRDSTNNQLPYLDKIEVSFMTDEDNAFKAFTNKKIDFITGLSSDYINKIINKDGSIGAEYAQGYQVEKTPIINTEYIGFQLDSKQYGDNPNHPLLNIYFRKALNYIIDRDEIIEELRRNLGQPAHYGLVPPSLIPLAKPVKGYRFNAKKIYELLDSAGFSNGKGLPELTFYTIPSALYLAEYVQAKFRQFGIQIKIEVNNANAHIGILNTGQAKIFRVRWLADYPDAENYLSLFHSNNLAPGPNKTRYENRLYDSLYAKACIEPNDTLRQNIYAQMEQMIMDDCVIIPIYYDETLQLSQKNIIGKIRGGAYNFKLEKIDISSKK